MAKSSRDFPKFYLEDLRTSTYQYGVLITSLDQIHLRAIVY